MTDSSTHVLPLLTTKLYRPPVTPELEQRTRLIERLENRRQRPLTLISAPAGYGKTMLASMWLESCGCSNGWISLDEHDNDLHTFASYLLAALRCALPEIQINTRSLLEAPTIPPVPVLARYLLNDLDQIQEPFILVLDDTQCINEPAIYELLDELLRHPPQSVHLVLIGRHDPRVNIATLRAHGQVTEIRAQDLRFTAQETRGMLSSMLDRQVDEEIAVEWTRMTEGWVTALRLAAISLRHRGRADDLRVSIHGDSRYLSEYLLGEVLAHLPVANQAWLFKSALLDRFCASLIEAVCRKDEDPEQLTGTEFFGWLELENLFLVPLDDRGEWFRFHHLFQQLLLEMLQTHASPDEIAALLSSASRWHADHGSLDEALQYALAAGDVQAAVHLILLHRYNLMNTEQWSRLERWLKLLPGEVVAQNPLLLSTNAYIATYRGQYLEMISCVQQAENLLADLIPETTDYQIARGEIDTICAVLDNIAGRVTRSMEHTQRSLKYLPRNALHMRAIALGANAVGLQMMGDPQAGATVISNALAKHTWPVGLQAQLMFLLCIAFFQEGDLDGVLTSARAGLWIMDKDPLPATLNFLRYFQGVVHYLRNEFTQAETVLRDLLKDRATAGPTYLANGSFALALIYQAQNHPAQVLQVIDLLKIHFQEIKDSSTLMFVEAFQVELALRQGELEEARRLSKGVEFEPRLPTWFFYVPQLTKIKLLLAEGKPSSIEDAYTRLDVMAETMGEINRKNVLKDVLALQALVCAAQGDEPTAIDKLCAALDLGIVGGDIRSFADLGAPMADLLIHLKARDAGREYKNYVDLILAAIPKDVRAKQTSGFTASRIASQPPKTTLIEPLTRRELQVLNLLSTDLSMQEIADRLVISLNTLHVHCKNIYRKLDVHKRVEAIQLADKLDIL